MPCSSSDGSVVDSFGIYIKTHRPDYHLAKGLIASLWEHAPGCPITLIPDDGYESDTHWGMPAMRSKDPFVQRLKGYYKKLWVFFGLCSRFIYIDSDMPALAPFSALGALVRNARKPFLYVCAEQKFVDIFSRHNQIQKNAARQKHVGELELLATFDPADDPQAAFPFNSSFFVTTRDIFPVGFLHKRFKAVEAFHNPTADKSLCFSREGLFMGDQGFLNYLLAKRQVQPSLLLDLWHWGGREAPPDVEQQRKVDPLKHLPVHWAGCPRPSVWSGNVPLRSQWRESYKSLQRSSSSRAAASREYARLAARDCREKAARAVKSALKRVALFGKDTA